MPLFSNRRALAMALILLLLSIMGACATSSTTKTEEVAPDASILRVGVSTNYPPLIFKENKAVTGLEAQLALALARDLGKEAVFVELLWRDQIPALLDNRIDIIMSGMSVTKMRQEKIAFSNPYFKTGQMVLLGRGSEFQAMDSFFTFAAQSVAMRLGVVAGTTGETFVKHKFKRARAIRSYPTHAEAVYALDQGQIDAMIHDGPIILMLAQKNREKGLRPLPEPMTEEYLAWGFRKGDDQLREAANGFLEKSSRDGRLTSMVNQWIPSTKK